QEGLEPARLILNLLNMGDQIVRRPDDADAERAEPATGRTARRF
ncbi:MAG: hypothetical protein JWM91_3375, partial [Rhodospirillales bacterium]|nr:hypothetical protein [Rhodospirillales bacterium]